jgi:drug/metabolite transporter (DMT)-like permease
VFVVVFGALFFGRRIRPSMIVPLAVCFAGVLLVLFDATPYPPAGNLIGIAAGMLGGVAVHFVQLSLRRNSSFIVYLSACVFGAAATSFSLFRIPDLPPRSWCLLGVVGVFAFTGQILMTKGYRYISATGGSIAGLAEVPLTVCASAAILGEHITARFVAGAAVIVAGLVLNFLLAGGTRPSGLCFRKVRDR